MLLSSPALHCFPSLPFPELLANPPDGIMAGPITEDNLLEWEATLM